MRTAAKITLLWLVTRIILFGVVGSLEAWNQGDVHFYLEIASTGYQPGYLSNCGWCPGFPLLLKLFPVNLSNALILNNLVLLAALLLLNKLQRLDQTPEEAWRGLLLLLAFPSAYFLAAPLSESTFLCFSVGAFWAARTGRWALAGLLGGAASLTRVMGLLLLPALLLEKPEPKQAPWLTLIPIGQLLFCLHLQKTTGDFWAYYHIQRRLEPHISGWARLARNQPLDGQHWIGIACTAAALVLMGLAWKRLRSSERFYCLASLALPLYHSLLVSTGRLMIVLTPLFSRAAPNRHKTLFYCIIAIFLILQLFAANLYSLANPYLIY